MPTATEYLPDPLPDALAGAGLVVLPLALADHLADQYRAMVAHVGPEYAGAVVLRLANLIASSQQTARAKWGERATWSRGRGWHEAGTDVAR